MNMFLFIGTESVNYVNIPTAPRVSVNGLIGSYQFQNSDVLEEVLGLLATGLCPLSNVNRRRIQIPSSLAP